MNPISRGGKLTPPPPVGKAIKEIIGYFVIGSNPSKNHTYRLKRSDILADKPDTLHETYTRWGYLETPH